MAPPNDRAFLRAAVSQNWMVNSGKTNDNYEGKFDGFCALLFDNWPQIPAFAKEGPCKTL
jgi:hypothetical protein